MNATTLESVLPGDDEKRQQNIILFQERQIRHAFIRKVFSIVIAQITVTCVIVAPMILHQPTREMLIKDRVILFGSLILFFAVHIAIAWCIGVTRPYPQNYIILFVLTISTSVLVGCYCAGFDPKLVLIAIGICLVLFTALYLLATQTVIDFTTTFAILVLLVSDLILFLIFIFIVIWSRTYLTWIWSLLIFGVVSLPIYFVFDIQRMMGGRHKYPFAPEDYILAAITLYVDIILLFLWPLIFLGIYKN